jgi:hypothetical protein
LHDLYLLISYFYTGSLRKRIIRNEFDNQLVNKAVVDFLRNAKDRKGGRAARGRKKRPFEEEEIQEDESSNINEEDNQSSSDKGNQSGSNDEE